MEPQQNSQKSSRLNKIRSGLTKLPIIKSKTIQMEEKLEKRNKRQETQNNEETENEDKIGQNMLKDLNSFEEKYEMGQKIGQGTNGIVRKCFHKLSKKIYAVKIMTIDEEHRHQLKENFMAIKMLDHPNIVGFKAIYMDYRKHTAYLIMDYQTMPNLKKIQNLTEDDLRIIMKQLLQTLEYIHLKKVCHRDIKPDNILFEKETKSIKIIDFGISKKFIYRNQRRDMLTITGTPNYRAPQMFLGGGYDERVDLWAAGVTLYKLASGKTPFQSEYVSDTINNIIQGKVQFPDVLWSFYSKFIKDLIVRLLKKPEQRLSAQQARKHFWFSSELKQSQNFLTQSFSFQRHLTGKKTNENQDDFLLKRSQLTDGKTKDSLNEVRSELKKWIVNSDKESVVIEIASDEEQTPLRKGKLDYPKEDLKTEEKKDEKQQQ